MASLNFETEKSVFRDYYSENLRLLENATGSFRTLISALLNRSSDIYISKVEGRVKEKEECIKKFNVKYRKALEANDTKYSIKEHITDLIGLRIVCLYEDDIEKIRDILSAHFIVLDETDKISQIESTEASFGYKGLHLDLKLGDIRVNMPEYEALDGLNFEIQIRTIIQDSWSVLDHKIKYKKIIPTPLKRRINTLAALFELADREFKEIRIETAAELERTDEEDTDTTSDTQNSLGLKRNGRLNAFGFLKIAKHFFSEYEFEDYKVDGFTEEIVSIDPKVTRTDFNEYMKSSIAKVKQYKVYFEESSDSKEELNPFTIIRHCLYLHDKEMYSSMLTNVSKEAFDKWLGSQNS